MELLKSNEKNELKPNNFYSSYSLLVDIEIYEHNIRYYDEEFIIRLFAKLKTQKLNANMNYRLHSNYILFSVDAEKLQKKSFSTYKQYLEHCVAHKVTYIPSDETEPCSLNRRSQKPIQRVKTALNISGLESTSVYDLCAALGKRTYEVYACKQDYVAMYLTRKNYLKYQNYASRAFKIKREFLTNVFSPIENFEKMYSKLINSLNIKLMYKNCVLFNINDGMQYVYIIKKGEIELSFRDIEDDKRLCPILRCTRGSLVGEFEIINRRQHRCVKATVLSAECIVYCIQIEYFKLFLNLSKPFRKKIVMQAKEKYKRVLGVTKGRTETARQMSTKRMPNSQMRQMMLGMNKSNITNQKLNTTTEHHAHNISSPLVKLAHTSTSKTLNNQALLQKYLNRSNPTLKLNVNLVNMDSTDREMNIKRIRNTSLTSYIQCTTDYVKNHNKNYMLRQQSTDGKLDKLYLRRDRALKSNKSLLNDSKNTSNAHRSENFAYFSNFLKNKFTNYNSYYNTVTNSEQLSRTQKEYVLSIRKRLERNLCESIVMD